MLLYNNKDYRSKNVLKQMAMTVLILQFTGTVKSNYVSTRTSEGHGKGKFSYSCPSLFLPSSTERNSCTDPEQSLAGLYWIKMLYFDHFITDSRLKYT